MALQYEIVTNSIGNDAIKWPAQGCNYIEFINNGDASVFVNEIEILPFGSWVPVPPLSGEQDFTTYRLKFSTGTVYNLVSVRKFYKEV